MAQPHVCSATFTEPEDISNYAAQYESLSSPEGTQQTEGPDGTRINTSGSLRAPMGISVSGTTTSYTHQGHTSFVMGDKGREGRLDTKGEELMLVMLYKKSSRTTFTTPEIEPRSQNSAQIRLYSHGISCTPKKIDPFAFSMGAHDTIDSSLGVGPSAYQAEILLPDETTEPLIESAKFADFNGDGLIDVALKLQGVPADLSLKVFLRQSE